jgi:hypothetical protein
MTRTAATAHPTHIGTGATAPTTATAAAVPADGHYGGTR